MSKKLWMFIFGFNVFACLVNLFCIIELLIARQWNTLAWLNVTFAFLCGLTTFLYYVLKRDIIHE